MSNRSFLTQLGIGTLLLAVAVYLIDKVPLFSGYTDFYIISMLIFIAICIGMFFFGRSAARSTNKNSFTSLVMISIFGKMFIILLLIVIYTRITQPDSKMFLLPFILIYVYYTAFETYFLMKLGKLKPGSGE